ncbi:MAG: anaerobic ribonucleoside-triphosphate reductase activating protein [bacterium]
MKNLDSKHMIIGGLQKFSLLDYPNEISAIIFTAGCNFRCQYCYNPILVCLEDDDKFKNNGEKGRSQIDEEGLFNFLKNRVEKLNAVVITGGEPTMHDDLPDFILKIKKLSFKVKLDTNGTNPKMLQDLIKKKLIDYIAMDIKGGKEKYNLITGTKVDFENIQKSIIIIKKSGLPYEFRTTLVPDLVNLADIKEIGRELRGASNWFLQRFRSNSALINNDLKNNKPYNEEALRKMRATGAEYAKKCLLR